MMVSFVLSFFPRDVLDEILNLIESVSEDFPSYSYTVCYFIYIFWKQYYWVSQKMWTFFLNEYNSFIYHGIFPKFCVVVAKMILLGSGDDSIVNNTSAGSDIIMMSNFIYDIIFFHLHC